MQLIERPSVLGRMGVAVREQFAFLLVLLCLAAAFVYLIIEPGRWGRATGILSVAVLLGGALRLLLPTGYVGSLAVRGRVMDTVTYLALGGALLGLDIRLHG